MITGLLIILLSALDAAFTTVLLGGGGTELNPFIASLMEVGGVWILVKMLLTIAGVWVLVKYEVRVALRRIAALYILVVTYEIVMVIQLYQ